MKKKNGCKRSINNRIIKPNIITFDDHKKKIRKIKIIFLIVVYKIIYHG